MQLNPTLVLLTPTSMCASYSCELVEKKRGACIVKRAVCFPVPRMCVGLIPACEDKKKPDLILSFSTDRQPTIRCCVYVLGGIKS